MQVLLFLESGKKKAEGNPFSLFCKYFTNI